MHSNPFGKINKRELIKNSVRIINGNTFSKYGNKWGRKPISEKKETLVKKYLSEGLQYREIANRTNISIGKISNIVKNKK